MRLDHLLSKEQLGRETGPVARDLRMSGRGAQRRRHWPVRTGNGRHTEYTRVTVTERIVLVRLGTAHKSCTLLGPERTTVAVTPVVFQGNDMPGMTWLLIPLLGEQAGGRLWGCGLVVG